jgi:hypothetical protein
MPSWRGAQLKHSGNFTFTFYNLTFILESPIMQQVVLGAVRRTQKPAYILLVLLFRISKDFILIYRSSVTNPVRMTSWSSGL